MQSKIFPFGISLSVFTEALAMAPPSTTTLEVTILVGFVTSFFAYASPLGQVLPVTVISSPFIVTVIGQPMGQPMQINSLTSLMLLPPPYES